MPDEGQSNSETQTTEQQNSEGGEEQGDKGGRTFTQSDLDRIVSERLRREREKLGDVDDLRRKASEFDKLQEASKTELEKEREQRTKLETEKTALQRELQETRLRGHISDAATRLGFHDPEDAWRLLDLASVDVDENGKPKNADTLLKELGERKPHLVRPSGPGSADGGPRGANGSGGTDMNALIRRSAGKG